MRIILAAILTAAVMTPAAANSMKSSDTVIIKKHRAHAAYAYVPVAPRYIDRSQSQNVYVDGVYVGRDPDWRVRETLRQENRGNGKL